jgi:predicted acylesterase/phospholipase RssA/CRP-like cAMP-binding protein
MWTFRSTKQAPLQELIVFLKSVHYFQELPEYAIIELANKFKAYYVQSGEIIIRQGDFGDGFYIVQSGRLLVIKSDKHSADQLIGEANRGDIVGEFALFTAYPRTATVVAIRDSVLWKLSKTHFDEFIQKNSVHIMPMVRSVILKVLAPRVLKNQVIRAIAITSAGRLPIGNEFSLLLTEQLSRHAPTVLINYATIKQQFKEHNSGNALEIQLTDPRITQWLNEQEHIFPYVIYETDETNTEWTRLCLRQADKILLIGDAAVDSPQLGSIEQYLFSTLENTGRAAIELVLLQNQHTILPSRTIDWLGQRSITKIHHVRKSSEQDMQRLVRQVTGRGVALVLGGGGARALAHIGVYKALCELNIPVDYVAGTSMGSIVAAAIAMDLSLEQLIEYVTERVVKNKKMHDYTLPIVSLLSGAGWLEVLAKLFGENVYIEDLWRGFFCVSSNFTRRKMEVLSKGLLYKAVRASASLPGVVPPISNENNELLIDGGIYNNLPVDLMNNLESPGSVIAVRVSPFTDVLAEIPDGVVSGIGHYWSYLRGDKQKRYAQIPSLAEIVAGAITLRNDESEQEQFLRATHGLNINLSGFGILDFSKFPELLEVGYQEAMRLFQEKGMPHL